MERIPDPRTSPAELTVETVRAWQLELTEVERRIGAHGSRGDVRRRLGAYLRGLLKPVERKNGWQLAEANGDHAPYGVQHLVGRAVWDPEAVRDERFARHQGFQKDGDDRFYHTDGSWIARTHGARFPWERRNASGELVRSYWPKDHCLDLEPLQLEADLWSLIDKFPERYSLVLASPSGQPIEVPGVGLRAMLEQGQLKIYPAAYRLVIGVQA